ncbi:unnamed protein product [Linum trigynum]|uniref:Uncharacterized protein n=1 Tax=Linum trigynum TaxID=586398 RepID=A0AAV2FBB7_9ROSI
MLSSTVPACGSTLSGTPPGRTNPQSGEIPSNLQNLKLNNLDFSGIAMFILPLVVFLVGVVWFYFKYSKIKSPGDGCDRSIDKLKWTLMSTCRPRSRIQRDEILGRDLTCLASSMNQSQVEVRLRED